MGGLFPPRESSSQNDDNVSDDSGAVPTQDTSEADAPPDAKTVDAKMVVDDDDENPF